MSITKMISMEQQRANKCDFLDILIPHLQISEQEELLAFLNTSDFWKAPASTKYHDSVDGGLVYHSLETYRHLVRLDFDHMLQISPRSLAITGLMHDICKANFYQKVTKNKRMEDGTWMRVQEYGVNDEFPFGHGEKSVALLLQHGVKLTEEQMLAIRWHMGGWDPAAQTYIGGQTLSNAQGKHKLVTALHIADMMATYF